VQGRVLPPSSRSVVVGLCQGVDANQCQVAAIARFFDLLKARRRSGAWSIQPVRERETMPWLSGAFVRLIFPIPIGKQAPTAQWL
jgi:hypothetical protein